MSISNNYEFLKDLNVEKFNKYYVIINRIENSFEDNGLPNIVSELLKMILSDVILNENGKNYNFSSMSFSEIKKGSLMVIEKHIAFKNNLLESKYIINNNFILAINTIQNGRNNFTHDVLNEKYYMPPTPIDKISFLRAIHTILNYLINEYYDISINVNSFNENFYFEKLNLKSMIDEKDPYIFDSGDIKSDLIKIGDFVLNPKNLFIIPEYQRDYSWEEDNCLELLNDIYERTTSHNKVYFGSIATITDCSKSTNSNKFMKIIDGQQRITTSLLFFAAVHEILNRHIEINNLEEEAIIPDYINKGIVNNKLIKNKFESRIIDSRKNFNFKGLLKIIDPNQRSLFIASRSQEDLYLKGSKVYDNYTIIYNCLSEKDIDIIIKMSNCFYENFVISKVDFQDSSSSEMEIFENLNSKGMELSTQDTVKNHIFNLIDPKVFDIKSQDVVNIYTEYLEIKSSELKKGKDLVKTFEDFLLNLLKYLAVIEKRETIGKAGKIKQNKKSLLKHLKLYLGNNKLNIDKYESICHKLGKYLKIYIDTLDVDKVPNESDWKYAAFESFYGLSEKKITILAFYFYDKFGNNWNYNEKKLSINNKFKETFKECLFEIERWIIFLIQTRGTGQSLTDVYLSLISYLEIELASTTLEKVEDKLLNFPIIIRKWLERNLDDFQMKSDDIPKISEDIKIPNIETIKENLKEIKKNYIKNIFLSRLELSLMNRKNNDVSNKIIREKGNTIEHIMPQKILNTSWVNDLKVDGEKVDVTVKHAQLLNYLGNLLLLNNKENASGGNKPFKEKKILYKNDNNIFVNQNFSENPSVNLSIETVDNWSFKFIEERTDKLAKMLLSIYKFV